MNETNSSITINFSGTITVPGHDLKGLVETALKAVLPQNLPAKAPTPAQEAIVPKKLIYTADEVAQFLSISTKTVYRLIQRRLLEPLKSTGHIRIPAASVEKFIRTSV